MTIPNPIVDPIVDPIFDPTFEFSVNDYIFEWKTASDVLINGDDGNDSIYNDGWYVTLDGGAGNDKIDNTWWNVTINGGDGNDSVYNTGADVAINGGAGNDSIICDWGGSGTIRGGKGDDYIQLDYYNYYDLDDTAYVIQYAAGDGYDHIFGYGAMDTIEITDGSSYSIETVGSGGGSGDDLIFDADGDVIIRFSDGAIYLERALYKTLNIVGIAGVKIKPTSLNIGDPFEGTVDAANFSSKIKKLDASKATGAVNLIGNDNKNVLKAGSGGSTLAGGGGKDKLYGGDGRDVFVFDGQGKDKVINYGAGDRLVLKDEITKVKVSGKKVTLTVGSGTLTIDKIVGSELTITDVDGVTNTYVFDKNHKTLETALVDGGAQLPTEDYWFDQSLEQSPLNEILLTEDTALDLSKDFLSPPALGSLQLSMLNGSARRLDKK